MNIQADPTTEEVRRIVAEVSVKCGRHIPMDDPILLTVFLTDAAMKWRLEKGTDVLAERINQGAAAAAKSFGAQAQALDELFAKREKQLVDQVRQAGESMQINWKNMATAAKEEIRKNAETMRDDAKSAVAAAIAEAIKAERGEHRKWKVALIAMAVMGGALAGWVGHFFK